MTDIQKKLELLKKSDGVFLSETVAAYAEEMISIIQELTAREAKLVEGLKAIAIPDGDIGTTIYESELERCQGIASVTLQEIGGE